MGEANEDRTAVIERELATVEQERSRLGRPFPQETSWTRWCRGYRRARHDGVS